MESDKISLSSMAERVGCGTDRLLALAEAEKIDLFARIRPCTAILKNRCGEPAFGSPTRTINSHLYSVLLPHEISALRADGKVVLKVLREKGAENGCLLPVANTGCQLLAECEEFFYWFDELPTIGIDQVFVNHDVGLPLDVMFAAPPLALQHLAAVPADEHPTVEKEAPEKQQPETQEPARLPTAPASPSFPDSPPSRFDKDNLEPASQTQHLATTQQLIDAFKCNPKLFENVHKTLRLKEARKVAGRGGKKSSPAMYDPYLVMEYLIERGDVEEKKAWAILECKFPDRYSEIDIGDPRQK